MKTLTAIILSLAASAALANSQPTLLSDNAEGASIYFSEKKAAVAATVATLPSAADEADAAFPSYSYPETSDPSLVAFRKISNLDAIAGQGSSITMIANLLHWTYQLTHSADIDKSLFTSADAAKIYNQALLSMGFKSKVIYVFRENDSTENLRNIRAVNSVYIPEQERWIFADPSCNTLVSDSKGNLLGIDDIFYTIQNDKDAFLNTGSKVNVAQYGSANGYLAEIFYNGDAFLQTPVETFEMNEQLDTSKVCYVQLVPEGYDVKVTYMKGEPDVYYTASKEKFWK